MKNFDKDNDVTYQLIPPGMHRHNAEERCIQNFKNHLVAGPSSRDDQSPLYLWYRIILQATLNLNMLRPLQRNPKISAHIALEGGVDSDNTPLVPPGTKFVVHENPKKRASWAAHGLDGWYLGPEMDHYRCYHVYVTNARAERNYDTLEFFPQHTKVPGIAAIDAATNEAQQLVTALSNPKPNIAVKKFFHRQLAVRL